MAGQCYIIAFRHWIGGGREAPASGSPTTVPVFSFEFEVQILNKKSNIKVIRLTIYNLSLPKVYTLYTQLLFPIIEYVFVSL